MQAKNHAGRLGEFLPKLQVADIDPEADAFGNIEGDPAVAPLEKAGKLVGYAFLNADVVDATGYLGEADQHRAGSTTSGASPGRSWSSTTSRSCWWRSLKSKVVHFIGGYIGRNVLEADPGATPTDIVSGATVSMMVVERSASAARR